MSIKFKLLIPALSVVLLTIVTVILLLILDETVKAIYMKFEIADRRKVEKALIASENQVREIIQKAPSGIALLDKEGWILECNPALQNMLGYDENELTGVLFVQAIHPQDIPLYKNNFQELVNGDR